MSGSQAVSGQIVLRIDGRLYADWTTVEVARDLGEIAGQFSVEHDDQARAAAGLPALPGRLAQLRPVTWGQAVRVEVDGEAVLIGWIDEAGVQIDGEQLSCRIQGRDRTGDLVDSTANPTGPAEYRGLTLTEIARRLCAPFGIAVRADVDVGAAFPRFSIDASETVMSALEKAARQRAVLVVSDGVGGLMLTRSGQRRGPEPLRMPGNVLSLEARLSAAERFRDYYVKGQVEGADRARQASGPALDGTARPLTPGGPSQPTPAAVQQRKAKERRGIIQTGHATDSEMTRYRPRVVLTRTQSGAASAQEQAEWQMRTARALGDELVYTVAGWRAGPERRLWRPNEVVEVQDPYAGFTRDMLVAGVRYQQGPDGPRTALRVVGREAFDLVRESDPDADRAVRRRERRREIRDLDGQARELRTGNGS